MINVGWIGTGKLGLPMAARIAASGTGVRAYVRSPERVEAIRARHVVCVTFDEMAAQNIVFSSLPDDTACARWRKSLSPRCALGERWWRQAPSRLPSPPRSARLQTTRV